MEIDGKVDKPLDRASPRALWLWAFLIVAAGIVLRFIWFDRYEGSLLLGYGAAESGHLWAVFGVPAGGIEEFMSLTATRSFAPGYGGLLRAAVELGGNLQGTRMVLLAGQSLMVAAATLIAFALARRVVFGWGALLVPLLMTASIPLLELPGGLAPQIPLMLLLVVAIWLLTLVRERVPDLRGAAPVFLTIATGICLGGGVLFNPAALLLVPLVWWWSFRGIGREHAALLIVATILLPACWLAVAQTQFEGGIATDQISAFADQNGGRVASSAGEVADRAYAFATPWNPRFARGSWSSTNWNYEWVIPLSVRADTNYVTATRVLSIAVLIVCLLLVIAGLAALMLEGAGSAARLLALPVVTLPLVTFVSPVGNLLRVPILPFLIITFVVGGAWLLERIRRGSGHQDADLEPDWT